LKTRKKPGGAFEKKKRLQEIERVFSEGKKEERQGKKTVLPIKHVIKAGPKAATIAVSIRLIRPIQKTSLREKECPLTARRSKEKSGAGEITHSDQKKARQTF